MSPEPTEYGIPVIFDVTAHTRQEAGSALVAMLTGHNIPGTKSPFTVSGAPRIESWWTLEAIDKKFDRNDNGAGIVLFDEDLDYLLRLLNEAWGTMPGLDLGRHDRLRKYLQPANRVGWAEDETVGA